MFENQSYRLKTIYLPKSGIGHRLSPITHSGFSSRITPSDQVIFSSAWLWTAAQPEDLQPRFSIGYPDEYRSLLLKKNWEVFPESIKIDFFLMRNLTENETQDLLLYLKKYPSSRVILLIGTMANVVSFISNLPVQELLISDQIYLSVLPLEAPFDSIARQHRVLNEIRNLNTTIPLYGIQTAEYTSDFYSELTIESIAHSLKENYSLNVKFFVFLEQLYNFIKLSLKRFIFLFKKVYWFVEYQVQTRILRKK